MGNFKIVKSELLYYEGDETVVDVPEGVKNILKNSFVKCNKVVKINFANTVKSIEERAIYNCRELKSVNIPENIENIGMGMTYGFNGETITVNSDNKRYSDGEGKNCIIDKKERKLVLGCKTSIIPLTVNIIGNSSFRGCHTIRSIVIPSTIERIEDYAFCGCENLEKITIPESVKYIGKNGLLGV